MATKGQNVVKVLLYVADDLERRHYSMAGVLRQLAREVATLDLAEPEPGRCCCGAVVVQPRTGRPRKFCTTCAPPRKRPGKRDDSGDGAATDQDRSRAA